MDVQRQVGGNSRRDRLRQNKPILSAGDSLTAGDGLNYFQFLSSHDARVGFQSALGRSKYFGEVYNIPHPKPRTWDQWHHAVAEALDVEAKIIHVPQDILIAIAPEDCGGLSMNFGHTQIFSSTKTTKDIPEFDLNRT